MPTDNMSSRMRTVWDVLERAKDCGDAMVIAGCRRLIAADRIEGRAGKNRFHMV